MESGSERTQHCKCGSKQYHVKHDYPEQEAWAECAECGRPTATLGDGMEKQRQWTEKNDSE